MADPGKNLGKLVHDPIILEAGRIVREMENRGLLVFCNPSHGLKIIGSRKAKPPTSEDLDIVQSMRHEIETMFALRTLSRHFMAESRASQFISNQ